MTLQYPVAGGPGSRLLLLLVGLSLIGTVACGHGQEKAAAEMDRLNRVALAEMKKGRAQEARKNLLEAVRVGQEAALTDDPIVARTHVALGAVYAGLNDDARAAAQMKAALERDPAIKLPKALASPAARKALAMARANAAKSKNLKTARPPAKPEKPAEEAAAKPAPAPAPPSPPVVAAAPPPPPAPPPAPRERPVEQGATPRITEPLVCRVPEEAPPENEIFFRCSLRADVRVSRVTLHYRPAGSETFTEVPLARNKRGWYTGAVPAEATTGKSVQYFVEGRGPTKVEHGTSESPNLIMVRDGAPPAGRDDPLPGRAETDDDEPTASSENEDPLAAVAKERERERDQRGSHRRSPGAFFVGLGLGTGYGWQPGGSLEFVKEKRVDGGQLAAGLVHVMPEVGYQLSEDLSLALQARLQFMPAQGSGDPRPGSPVERAHSVLARATYASGAANWRGLYSVYLGGGEGFRLRVPPDPEQQLVRSDTVRGGPVLAGAGLGFAYHATSHFAWTLELRALVGLPTIAAVADLSTGMEVAF